MKLLRQLFISSRPVSWVNTAYPFAAGYLLATGKFDAVLIVGTLFFLIPYNVLMYGLNDVFDYESDMRNPRKGGIEGGVVEPQLHKPIVVASISLSTPFIVWLLAQGNQQSNGVLLFVVFMVVAYSVAGLRFKERPILDSFTSSTHFWGPLAYALVLTGTWSLGWPAVLAFAFWGMASHALGAVQDIIADKKADISSIATKFGAAWTVRFAIVLYVASSIMLAYAYSTLGLVMAFMGLCYVANAWPYRNITDTQSTKARGAWKRFLWLNYAAGAVLTIGLLLQSVVRT